MAGACLALPQEEHTWLLALHCACVCVCDARTNVCMYISRSWIVDLLSPQFDGPLVSSPWKRDKGVMVLIAVPPPSASLPRINIHGIDLFSEWTKNKLFAGELILTGAWHCCVLFEEGRQRKYAYADTVSKTPIKCWLSLNYCGTVCVRGTAQRRKGEKKRSLLFSFPADMKNECS